MYVCINQYGYMRVKWIKKSEQCSGKRGQWQGWKGSGLHRRQRAATLTQANYFQTLSEIKTKGSHTDTGKLYIQTLSEISHDERQMFQLIHIQRETLIPTTPPLLEHTCDLGKVVKVT